MSEQKARRLMSKGSIRERNQAYTSVKKAFAKAGRLDGFPAWFLRVHPLSREGKTLLNKAL